MNSVAQLTLVPMPKNHPSGPDVSRLDVLRAIDREAKAQFKREQQMRLAERDREFGILELTNLVDTYGLANVERWLRNIAASLGPLSPSSVDDPRR